MDTDVLIVGAGPVGLFLANECARCGLRFRLIEAQPSQSVHSGSGRPVPRSRQPSLDLAYHVTGYEFSGDFNSPVISAEFGTISHSYQRELRANH
jgi:flavin-dependent dehydrogenase